MIRPASARLGAAIAFAAAMLSATACLAAAQAGPLDVVGDRIGAPLTGHAGDPAQGRRIVLDRNRGNCLICHVLPEPGEPLMGDVGPDLSGVGSRLDAAQLRLRLVDAARVNPDTVMPPYHRIDGLNRVGRAWLGKPVLSAAEIEDVVAYLAKLRQP